VLGRRSAARLITDRGQAELADAGAVWADFSRALTTLLETGVEVTA